MMNNPTLCIRVSAERYCPYCKGAKVVKNGTTKNKKQQYHCKSCFKRFILNHTYLAYHQNVNENIILLTKEGLGIRSIARVLKISTTNLIEKNYRDC